MTIIVFAIKEGLQPICDKVYLRGNINQMWILKNLKTFWVILILVLFWRVYLSKNFDFPTLYTAIPHKK
jgi:hypothetical protein